MRFVSLWVFCVGCEVYETPQAFNTFELVGKHADVPCEGCHDPSVGLRYVPTVCEYCHEDDRPVDHYEGGCGDCHSEYGWDQPVVTNGRRVEISCVRNPSTDGGM